MWVVNVNIWLKTICIGDIDLVAYIYAYAASIAAGDTDFCRYNIVE